MAQTVVSARQASQVMGRPRLVTVVGVRGRILLTFADIWRHMQIDSILLLLLLIICTFFPFDSSFLLFCFCFYFFPLKNYKWKNYSLGSFHLQKDTSMYPECRTHLAPAFPSIPEKWSTTLGSKSEGKAVPFPFFIAEIQWADSRTPESLFAASPFGLHLYHPPLCMEELPRYLRVIYYSGKVFTEQMSVQSP